MARILYRNEKCIRRLLLCRMPRVWVLGATDGSWSRRLWAADKIWPDRRTRRPACSYFLLKSLTDAPRSGGGGDGGGGEGLIFTTF